MPVTNRPVTPIRMHNRATGLTGRVTADMLTDEQKQSVGLLTVDRTNSTTNKIAPGLSRLVVPIEPLQLDPNNARLHPEKNLEAIKDSLCQYGQVKPIVVRKGANVVIAGNGTLESAKALGWTKIAAVFVEMDELSAAGYGLADNRTSELAKWNFEVWKKLDTLLKEKQHPTIGWGMEELLVLRAGNFTKPENTDDEPYTGNGKDKKGGEEEDDDSRLTLRLTPEQRVTIDKVINAVRAMHPTADLDDAVCVDYACDAWLRVQFSKD